MRIRLQKRLDLPKWSSFAIPVVSVLIALLVMGIVIYIYEVYQPSYFKGALYGTIKEYVMSLEKTYEKYKAGVLGYVKGNEREVKETSFMRSALSGVASAYGNFTMKGLSEVLRNYEEVFGFMRRLEGKKHEKDLERFQRYTRSLRKAKDEFSMNVMRAYYEFYGRFRDTVSRWDEKIRQKIKEKDTAAVQSLLEGMKGDIEKLVKDHEGKLLDLAKPFIKAFDKETKEFGVHRAAFMAVWLAYKELFTWPFMPSKGLPDSFTYMIPLLFIGLGLILVFQMKLWNIGAEGQYYFGVMAATWLSLFVIRTPHPAWIPFIVFVAGLAGAMWGMAAGALKAFLNIDEIVTTLMLNYIAYHLMEYLVYGPWKAPTNFPETKLIPESLRIPTFEGTRINYGIFLALAMSVVVYLIMKRTWWGFKLRVIGDNQMAAMYSGINIKRNIVLAMMVSGFMAGLAGGVQMLGFEHKLIHSYHPGYGYTGIIIAWLARLNAWGTIIVSFLFGALLVGGNQLQIDLKLPKAMVEVIQGALLFSLLASEVLFRYEIKVVRE